MGIRPSWDRQQGLNQALLGLAGQHWTQCPLLQLELHPQLLQVLPQLELHPQLVHMLPQLPQLLLAWLPAASLTQRQISQASLPALAADLIAAPSAASPLKGEAPQGAVLSSAQAFIFLPMLLAYASCRCVGGDICASITTREPVDWTRT